MITITEGRLTLTFGDGCSAGKYDESNFYTKYFQNIREIKALDVVCVKDNVSWLIEITGYRNASEPKKVTTRDLVSEVVKKTVDTIAGVAVATVNCDNDMHEIAVSALSANQFRIVLHLEGLDKLTIDLQSGIQICLRRRLRYIDKNTMVVNIKSLSQKIPWTVRET